MMRTAISGLIKSALLGLAALVIIGASHQSARADEVTLTGSTAGTCGPTTIHTRPGWALRSA